MRVEVGQGQGEVVLRWHAPDAFHGMNQMQLLWDLADELGYRVVKWGGQFGRSERASRGQGRRQACTLILKYQSSGNGIPIERMRGLAEAALRPDDAAAVVQ